jgi:hypothetical protein
MKLAGVVKLVGLVILGLVSSFAIWLLSGRLYSLILKAFGVVNFNLHTDDMTNLLGVVPFSFFIGSIVTGYFSYYDIEDKGRLCFMAPPLYLVLLFISQLITARRTPFITEGAFFVIVFGFVWYLSSLAGVFLGYYLRERLAK